MTSPRVLDRRDLPALLAALREGGRRILGPTVRDGAILYDEIGGVEDLPAGWTDEQDAGRYRLKRREDQALFGWVVGPHSWKKFLFPPSLRLWSARRSGSGFEVADEPAEAPAWAFLGVRPCDLRAIAIQDRVFLGGAHVDPTYRSRRDAAFVVAVNCTRAGGTCFCTSLGAGPRANARFDLALTELLEGKRHRFLVEIGSEAGAAMAARLPTALAKQSDRASASEAIAAATTSMGRRLATDGLAARLAATPEHPHWEDVARRCLACANCTMVCPTCFCSTVEDVTDLTGDHAERWRRWDSCFTMDHSYLHGGSVRATIRSRYRQWLTHKLSSWHEQFGTSGCVGCGRCITWCPAGIDLTREAEAIRSGGTPTDGKP